MPVEKKQGDTQKAQEKLREAARVTITSGVIDLDRAAAELDRILGYSELVQQLSECKRALNDMGGAPGQGAEKGGGQ